MDVLTLILATFATFRLAWLITREEGPFGLFASLRERIDPSQRTWLGRGLNCVNCVSFWVSLALVLLCGGGWLDWLAVAGVVVLINKWVMR